jgi:hypothetical protein
MDEEIISVRWLCELLRFKITFGFGLKLMPGALPSLPNFILQIFITNFSKCWPLISLK